MAFVLLIIILDDEVIVAASERAAIRTSFNVGENEVHELMPGNALIVRCRWQYKVEQVLDPKERRACSFERIYFSAGAAMKKFIGKELLWVII